MGGVSGALGRRATQTRNERLLRSTSIAVVAVLMVWPLFRVHGDDSRSQTRQTTQSIAPEILDELVTIRLARSASLANTQIAVTEKARVITLHGVVYDEGQRQRAEEIARRTRGVRDVKNEIEVDSERRIPLEAVSDEVLAREVATKLASDTLPSARAEEDWIYGWEVEGHNWEFDVEVDGGRVTLEGTVGEFEDLARAVSEARTVPGVRSVDARLSVANYLPIPRPFGFSVLY